MTVFQILVMGLNVLIMSLILSVNVRIVGTLDIFVRRKLTSVCRVHVICIIVLSVWMRSMSISVSVIVVGEFELLAFCGRFLGGAFHSSKSSPQEKF